MGGVRTALYNYLFAKQHNGDFLIRIEDTDQTRFVPGAMEYIFESLTWCGIIPDEGPNWGGNCGPYIQSQRQHMYRAFADDLIDRGHAYYAFDSAEELDEARDRAKEAGAAGWQYNHITRGYMKNSLSLSEDEVKERLDKGEPYVIRAKMPRNEEIRFYDEIRGWVSVNSTNLDDKVLFKSDGMPTYHLANIVDDHLMEITHVIRGEEWLPSAPLHVMLYRFFEWDQPKFAHLPLLLKPDGNGKLSKRDGDRLGFPVFPLEWQDPASGEISSGYREKGYYPGAFINMLALLGWNPGTNQELFTMQELISQFSLERVSKSGAKFDPEKTWWFNQQYLRMRSNAQLADEIEPLLKNKGITADRHVIEAVCGIMKERATFAADIVSEGIFLFVAPTAYDQSVIEKRWKDDSSALVSDFSAVLEEAHSFAPADLERLFNDFLASRGIGTGALMPLLRVVLTGAGAGPSLFDILALLGKEESLRRIAVGVAHVSTVRTS
jgi:glutamyl-tRNA synthetase